MMKYFVLFLVFFLFGCEDRKVIKRVDHSGYKGSVEMWRDALSCWRDALYPDNDFDFYGHDGSNDVAHLREKYSNLPLSYIHFVEAGGMNIGDKENMSFLSAASVDYFREFGENYDVWAELAKMYLPDIYDKNYFEYRSDDLNFNASEFDDVFIVGQEGDFESGLYLLNPLHRSIDDEWEGWYWYPSMTGGVRRFRSFAHLAAQKFTVDKYLKNIGEARSLYFDDADWSRNCFSVIIEKNW